jgi:branched-chain amino acid transport system ATP-binding protein
LKTVCGLLPVWRGSIVFEDIVINNSPPERNVTRGITFSPQGNRVLDELTVMENLEIGGFQLPRKELKKRIEEIFTLFPVLKEYSRQDAGNLSGGEQQMLSVARALIPKPKLLMLDEPSLGLAPGLIKSVFAKIIEINQQTGVTILIVEQKVREVLEICHRVYSIKLGKVAFEGKPDELKENREKLKQLFL